jgi:regulator of cell morphogenesis and NO signaling
VFVNHFIDYCNNGDVILKDYFKDSKVELKAIIDELKMAIANLPKDNIDYEKLSITETCELIRDEHHEYLRSKISELTALSMKIQNQKRSKAINNIHNLLLKMFNHLAPHMLQEEKVVFPYLEYMEHVVTKGKIPKPPSFGRVKKNVNIMLDEHQDSADQLNELREVTNNYETDKPGEDLKHFYDELAELDKNLRMHIHIENNVLFRKARQMELDFLKKA